MLVGITKPLSITNIVLSVSIDYKNYIHYVLIEKKNFIIIFTNIIFSPKKLNS